MALHAVRHRPGRVRIRLSCGESTLGLVGGGVLATGGKPVVITIGKAVLSGSTPSQIRDRTEGLASARLRDLAVQLAADPDLTVSVITYDDGTQELEVLHTGPPHHTEHTVDRRRFARQRPGTQAQTLSIADPDGLQHALALVRAILRDATS